MYKIGVVGPAKSVERIIALAREIEQDMEFIPYIYEVATETKHLVETYNQDVDFWLFSGYIPYKLASQTNVSKDKLTHIIFSEAAIYRGFLEQSYQQKSLLKMSVSTSSHRLPKWRQRVLRKFSIMSITCI